jgi:recombination protein RecA
VDKRGSYFTYQDTRLGQGRENVKVYLAEHPEVLQQLDSEIRARAGLNVHTFAPTDTAKVVPFAGREGDYDLEDAEDLAA